MSKHAQSNRGAGKPRVDTDPLDEQELDETFPASDPPSWTLGVEEDRREGSDDRKDGKDRSDRAGKAND